MKESTRKAILAYREALNYINNTKATGDKEIIAREYAKYYYMEKMQFTYLKYYESEEYMQQKVKESQEGESAFLEQTKEEVQKEIEDWREEQRSEWIKTRTILDYLREIVNIKTTEKYMNKYGWI